MADPNQEAAAQSATEVVGVSEFDSLLKKEFKPKTDEAKEAVERAVRTLAEQALSQTQLIKGDVVQTIESMIAAIDKKLTEQINLILHHEDFQKMEAAWRGLHYLVTNTETVVFDLLALQVDVFVFASRLATSCVVGPARPAAGLMPKRLWNFLMAAQSVFDCFPSTLSLP